MSARARREAGVTCPRCKQHAYRMTDGTLSEHRTEFYALGSNRKERCAYSGGTMEDARRSIPPLMRRTEAHIRAKLEREQREPNERERDYLERVAELEAQS